MTDPESKELLTRIDERGKIMTEKITNIEQHLREQNGKVNKSCERIVELDGRIDQLEGKAKDNRSLIVAMWGILGVLVITVIVFVLRGLGIG